MTPLPHHIRREIIRRLLLARDYGRPSQLCESEGAANMRKVFDTKI
jgi:hypothetical protein